MRTFPWFSVSFCRRAVITAATSALSYALISSTAFGGAQVVSGQAARTVWDGAFTESQAARGRTAFLAHCSECHGTELQGNQHKALKGDRFWADWQDTTVDYMLERISTSMPFTDDGALVGTLGMPTYSDIVAHILNSNGFPAGASELNAKSAIGVSIAKKEGGGDLPNDSFAHVVGCLVRGPDRAWRLQKGSRPVRVLTKRPVDVNVPLGDREYVLKFVLTSLDKYAGHKMTVQATLMGEGGSGGLNVRSIASVSATCE